MIRRTIAAFAGTLVAMALVAGPAQAQDSPPPQVMPSEVEAEVGAVLPAQVGGEQVAGVTQTRALPRTGNDLGVEVLAGIALVGAGVALAGTARARRRPGTA
jgi:hypothetical protein